jgi:hypothetical protein
VTELVQQILNGLSLGSIYALIALGATREANEIMAQHPIPGWDEDVRQAS